MNEDPIGQRVFRVLIVEDNGSQLRTLSDIVGDEGFEVVGCPTASEALDYLDGGRIDVAVVDLRLPDLSEGTLLEKLGAFSEDVPVIIHTGYSSFESAKIAINWGVFAYVEKVGDPAELLRQIHRAIQTRLLQRAKTLEAAVAERTGELEAANEALAKAEQDYRNLVEKTGDIPYSADAEGYFTYVGPQGERYGVPADEILGENLMDLVASEDREGVAADFQRSMSTGEEFPTEFRIRDVRGCVHWLEDSAKIQRGEDGRIVGLVGVLRDITERKKAEESLRESEAFLNTLLDAIPIPVFYKDTEGRYLGFNAAFEDFFGETRERLIGKTVFDINPPDLAETYHAKDNDLFESGGEQRYESRLMNAHEELREVIYQKAVFTDRAGTIAGLIGAVLDITDRKRAEKDLLLRDRAVNAATEGISITDTGQPDQPTVFVNQGFEHLTGYTADDVLGRNMRFLQGPATDPESVDRLRQAVSQGKPTTVELLNYRKDGSTFWNRVAITPVRNEAGEVTHFIDIRADVSEQRQEQERTRLSLKILEHLNTGGDKHEVIAGILDRIKQYTGVEAVGIRLREGDDYPYYATNGFRDHFVEKERHLCARDPSGEFIRDVEGTPVLDCLCGNVLCGRIDPSQPFYTDGGSFWTSSTTELLASATEEELLVRPRGLCPAEGYKSVALIPVVSGGEMIGLLQLNDRRPGQLTIGLIEFLESLGHSIGIALQRADATEALEASEARYKSLVESALVGVTVLQDDRIVFANQAMADIMGRSVAELCSLTPEQLRELFHPDDREMVAHRAKARLASEDVPSRYTFRIIRKNGSVAWLDHTVSLTSFDGRPASQGFSLDITERKQAEEALKESRKILEQQVAELNYLYDSSPAGFCVLDRDLRFVRINNVLATINGRPASEHYGRTTAEIIPDLADQVVPVYERVLETGQPELDVEVHGTTSAEPGVEKDWLVSYYPIKPDRGKIVGVGSVVQDITDRKKAEAQLRQRDAELAHLGRLSTMGEMATGIAHELNQPLYAVTNYVTAIRGQLRRLGADSADLIEMLDKTSGQVRRAAEIIKRLRNTVRKCEPRRSSTNVNDLIDEVVELMGHELRHHTITVHCDLHSARTKNA